MTNTSLLREKIEQSGYKKTYIAAHVGISGQCLSNKMTNKSEFVASEIQSLSDILKLNKDERDAIFFCS